LLCTVVAAPRMHLTFILPRKPCFFTRPTPLSRSLSSTHGTPLSDLLMHRPHTHTHPHFHTHTHVQVRRAGSPRHGADHAAGHHGGRQAAGGAAAARGAAQEVHRAGGGWGAREGPGRGREQGCRCGCPVTRVGASCLYGSAALACWPQEGGLAAAGRARKFVGSAAERQRGETDYVLLVGQRLRVCCCVACRPRLGPSCRLSRQLGPPACTCWCRRRAGFQSLSQVHPLTSICPTRSSPPLFLPPLSLPPPCEQVLWWKHVEAEYAAELDAQADVFGGEEGQKRRAGASPAAQLTQGCGCPQLGKSRRRGLGVRC
jgi:hypothetical protein